jgi:hypothetical protein
VEGQSSSEEGEIRSTLTLPDLNVALKLPTEEITMSTSKEKKK